MSASGSQIHLGENDCTGCGLCLYACPCNCIRMEEDFEGFLRPQIDYSQCVSCGKCVSACNGMSSSKKCCTPLKIYAAINNDRETRLKSSSGGIFLAIAQYFIEQSGFVVGAQFASDFSVEHAIANSFEGIEAFLTSKYVQSNAVKVFPAIKELLLKGEKVLFSGTPCQVAALHNYLPKEYDNLFCVDFICHGVPSPGLWRQYLEEIQGKNKSRISSISFRDKRWSWYRYALSIKFKNQSEYCKPMDKDPFLRIFLSDIALRPSCYDCKHRGYNRYADLTLSDFWTVKRHSEIPSDNKGISMIISNNNRAESILSEIRNKISVWNLPNTEDILKENPCYYSNPHFNMQRNAFFEYCNNNTIKKAASVFFKYKLIQRIRIELSALKQRLISIS